MATDCNPVTGTHFTGGGCLRFAAVLPTDKAGVLLADERVLGVFCESDRALEGVAAAIPSWDCDGVALPADAGVDVADGVSGGLFGVPVPVPVRNGP